eukprot:1190843-Prorocentrum_minimum.AAC.2
MVRRAELAAPVRMVAWQRAELDGLLHLPRRRHLSPLPQHLRLRLHRTRRPKFQRPQEGVRRGSRGGEEGVRRGSIGQVQTPSLPQNPTKSEEYQRHLQCVLYSTRGAQTS